MLDESSLTAIRTIVREQIERDRRGIVIAVCDEMDLRRSARDVGMKVLNRRVDELRARDGSLSQESWDLARKAGIEAQLAFYSSKSTDTASTPEAVSR